MSKESKKSARSVDVYITNETNDSFTLRSKKLLLSGEWTPSPSSIIKPNAEEHFGVENETWLTGCGLDVYYTSKNNNDMHIYFNNPHIGSNSYLIKYPSAAKDNYIFSYNTLGRNAAENNEKEHNIEEKAAVELRQNNANVYIKITTTKENVESTFNYFVASDPQPYRTGMDNNLDPNDESASGPAWLKINRNTVKAMNALSEEKKCKFTIINGDISEYGRTSQRDYFLSVYNQLKMPYYYGLGDHDIVNNFQSCFDLGVSELSSNGCAIGSISNMYRHITFLERKLTSFSFDFSGKTRTGSLAYSWDVGIIHFIQLQYSPSYQQDYTAADTTNQYITKSSDWLEKDLADAQERGCKNFYVNMHHPDLHSANNAEVEKFTQLLNKYNVEALFCGHTHQVTSLYKYGVNYFNSGALFYGDFLLVEVVKGKLASVKYYSGKTGAPELQKQL